MGVPESSQAIEQRSSGTEPFLLTPTRALMDRREQPSESSLAFPPTLRAEREGPPIPKQPWYQGIGPAYLTIFTWAPFFDPLWVQDLSRSSLPWLAGTAVMASMLCYVFFFYPMAIWGQRTGHGLGLVAALTFGTIGSEWITGMGIGAAQIVWTAVAIDYGVESTLAGLSTCELATPEVLHRVPLGPFSVRSPVFLVTAAFWVFVAGTACLLRLVGVVSALMRVYAPVALFLLTATALWSLPSLGDYQVENAVAVVRGSSSVEGGTPRDSAPTLFLGFFAMLGLLSVDWGSASMRRRDVTVGGLTGIGLAGAWSATMALLVIAGALGRAPLADSVATGTAAVSPPLSFRWGVIQGIGGYPASMILILFGLASLAPACYSLWVFSQRFATHWPGVPGFFWIGIGGGIALSMIALSWSSHIGTIDRTMGVLFAPALGAMSGDFVRQRGRWAGVIRGVNAAGLLAWSSGLALGWTVEFVLNRNPESVLRYIPSPILGFATAAILFGPLARIGLGSPPFPLTDIENPIELSTVRSDSEVPTVSHVTTEPLGSEPSSPDSCRKG